MCNILRVRWTITPRIAPQPWIACSGCGGARPFGSSGRIRLNANGKRLDAWLIYRCLACEKTWNRPLFERRALKEIDPATLEALHFSDPEWVRAREFDVDDLRRRARRIDECVEVDIRKETLSVAESTAITAIELKVPLSTCLRLDRLLTGELGISRTRLSILHGTRRLRIDPDRKDALRRRIKDRTLMMLEPGDKEVCCAQSCIAKLGG